MPTDLLTNPRAERVRAVRALSGRSVRERTGQFLAEGPQAVREAVRHAAADVVDLYLTKDATERHSDIATAAQQAGVRTHAVTPEVLLAMTDMQAPQGMVAVCRTPTPALAEVLDAAPRLLVVLAHVRDPGNAGTVIRGADAAGADAVLVSDASVDVHNPKVVRSTAGSIFHLPVVTGLELQGLLSALGERGILRYAADGAGAQTIQDVDLSGPHAWVMGNEAWGLDEQTRGWCDQTVRVPIHGRAESLNLAMAATVCLYASATAQRG